VIPGPVIFVKLAEIRRDPEQNSMWKTGTLRLAIVDMHPACEQEDGLSYMYIGRSLLTKDPDRNAFLEGYPVYRPSQA
jgi:hypothetical protein